ncbi:MAG TPA: 16S rRNA (adenine(1518)-N(6)/adenine(1519)-N(6))-dimethyltransferase RsmA [Candidatus Saccharimonadales bacterium]|nr:16S rRNA (adenine(1518)-N(6)/adenine(1519)-N(6))-dimethyltransferase RsmA [Candidatus Saccharimonadales bacterium]
MSDIVPKKALGQHWLHDEKTLQAICDSVAVGASDNVLEIGPGLGTLTRQLLARGAHVTAVEFDVRLAEDLSNLSLKDSPLGGNLTVVQQDILQFDLTALPTGYKVVANIPYYLTSNLIRVLCESSNPFSQAAILIQKEVAQRVAARPGDMSILSVSAQYYCEVSLGLEVPAKLFTPPPKVDSQVLVLTYRAKPLFEGVDTKQFFRLVKAGFSQKRKTLVNSLSGGLAIPKDEARTLLTTANIPESTRAQALSLDDWYALYRAAGKS